MNISFFTPYSLSSKVPPNMVRANAVLGFSGKDRLPPQPDRSKPTPNRTEKRIRRRGPSPVSRFLLNDKLFAAMSSRAPQGFFEGEMGRVAYGMLQAGLYAKGYLREAKLNLEPGHTKEKFETLPNLEVVKSVVTHYDHVLQRRLIPLLKGLKRGSRFVGEEGYDSNMAAALRSPKPLFSVDPIDGTSNFAKRNPNYCSSIAYLDDCFPRIGVLARPEKDDLLIARQGYGAFRVDSKGAWHRLRVKGALSKPQLIGVGFPSKSNAKSFQETVVTQLGKVGLTTEHLGSGALSIAKIAQGDSNAFVHPSSSHWDDWGATPILLEAGGKVFDFSGTELKRMTERRHAIVATDGSVDTFDTLFGNPKLAYLFKQGNVQHFLDEYNNPVRF